MKGFRDPVDAWHGATFAPVSDDGIRITFVRHGQTEANLTKHWQGQGDSPLSALGVQQARLVGERLKQHRFTRVWSSDLSRAMDTARATGFAFSVDPALREFDVGCWEGLTAEQVEAQYPEELARLRRGEDVPLGGGESFAAFSARIDAALDGIMAQLSPGDHALVVCHGGVIGTAMSGAFGLRKARAWSTARAANTSITEIAYTQEGARLHVFNDTLHLMPLGRWPTHGDLKGSVALLCDVPEQHDFGEFAVRYESEALFAAEGGSYAEPPEALGSDLSARLLSLARRHPEQRVALGVASAKIHSWAEATLLGDALATGTLIAPRAGSLSHAGIAGDRLLLLDYGITR
jgi:broad specificity phosphatase PhoE